MSRVSECKALHVTVVAQKNKIKRLTAERKASEAAMVQEREKNQKLVNIKLELYAQKAQLESMVAEQDEQIESLKMEKRKLEIEKQHGVELTNETSEKCKDLAKKVQELKWMQQSEQNKLANVEEENKFLYQLKEDQTQYLVKKVDQLQKDLREDGPSREKISVELDEMVEHVVQQDMHKDLMMENITEAACSFALAANAEMHRILMKKKFRKPFKRNVYKWVEDD